ncbi:hypothetical protein ACN27J_03230 [Solwaraspora sp. WMMB762]|uniref:hypothetical protein n=1 Tax=Solwaraspora sp. WMMB762 TaxID=3404120 RepID=UPI003B937EF8
MTEQQQRRTLFAAPDALTDSHALIEWCEITRGVLHAGALELGICASELEARLRRASLNPMGGLSARARARKVARPVQQAGEALVIASQYVITASNSFLAAYAPELDAAGFAAKPRPEFKFKA